MVQLSVVHTLKIAQPSYLQWRARGIDVIQVGKNTSLSRRTVDRITHVNHLQDVCQPTQDEL